MVSLKKWGIIAGFMGLAQSILWVAISFSFLIIHDLELNYKVSNNSLPLTFYEYFIKKDEEGPNLVSLFMIVYLLLSLFWFAASVYLLKTVNLEQEEPMILANTKRYSHLIWSILTFLVCVLDIAFTISITTGFVKVPYQRIDFSEKLIEVTTSTVSSRTKKNLQNSDLFWVAMSKREVPGLRLVQEDSKKSNANDTNLRKFQFIETSTSEELENLQNFKDHELSESKISGYLKQFVNQSFNNIKKDVIVNDSFISSEKKVALPDLNEVYVINNDARANLHDLPLKVVSDSKKVNTTPLTVTQTEMINSSYPSQLNLNSSTANSYVNATRKNLNISSINKRKKEKHIDKIENELMKNTKKEKNISMTPDLANVIDQHPIILNAIMGKANMKNEKISSLNKEKDINTKQASTTVKIDHNDVTLNKTLLATITKSQITTDETTSPKDNVLASESIIFDNEYDIFDEIIENSNESRDYNFEGKSFENFLESDTIPSHFVNEMKKISHAIHENLPFSVVSKFYNIIGDNKNQSVINWKKSPEYKSHLETFKNLQKSINNFEKQIPDWYTRTLTPIDEKHSFRKLPKLPSLTPEKVVVMPTKMLRNSSILVMLLIASRFGVLLLLNFMFCLVAFYLSMRYSQMYKEEKEQNANRLQRPTRRQTSGPNMFSDFNDSSTISFDRPRTPRANKNIAFVVPMPKD